MMRLHTHVLENPLKTTRLTTNAHVVALLAMFVHLTHLLRWRLFAALVCLVLALGLGCRAAPPLPDPPPQSSEAEDSDTLTLTIWHSLTGDKGQVWEAFAQDFSKTYPNLQINS